MKHFATRQFPIHASRIRDVVLCPLSVALLPEDDTIAEAPDPMVLGSRVKVGDIPRALRGTRAKKPESALKIRRKKRSR